MSPYLGYAAVGVSISCFSAIACRLVELPRYSSHPTKTWLVITVGLAAIAAVGLTFGVSPATALLGFALGCCSISEEDTIIEKICSIALCTLALVGMTYLYEFPYLLLSYGLTVTYV